MARKPRIHVPGGFYHVILRGNGGQDIFFNEDDRNHLYLLLQEGISRFGYRIHAFCFMTNHIHMALQVADTPLSKIMQNISFRYTRWINYRKRRFGHLFQGRYKAILVDMDNYLIQLIRYIHLNPIRAKIANTPQDYPWSSHNVYIGKEDLPWLTTEWALSQFAKRLSTARKLYQNFIHEVIDGGYGKEFLGVDRDSRFFGDDNFIEKTLARIKEKPFRPPLLDSVIATIGKEYQLTESQLKAKNRGRRESECRAVIGWIIVEMQCATLTEVTNRFNRDIATMSHAVRRLMQRAAKSRSLKEQLGVFLEDYKN